MKSLRQKDGWYVVHDGCIEIRWRNEVTGKVLMQRKRRPKAYENDAATCTWHESIYCDDHPTRGSRGRRHDSKRIY